MTKLFKKRLRTASFTLSSSETVSYYEKILLFAKGERQLGWKNLERHLWTVWTQGDQVNENIQVPSNVDPPYLKDPHSKVLEPNCLSPHLFNCFTVSLGSEEVRGMIWAILKFADYVKSKKWNPDIDWCHLSNHLPSLSGLRTNLNRRLSSVELHFQKLPGVRVRIFR